MISKKEVLHIASLARIELTPEEEEKFQKDLSSILDYVNSLQKLDTSSVKATWRSLELENVEREDIPSEKSKELADWLIREAPKKEGRRIKVKGIFKNES